MEEADELGSAVTPKILKLSEELADIECGSALSSYLFTFLHTHTHTHTTIATTTTHARTHTRTYTTHYSCPPYSTTPSLSTILMTASPICLPDNPNPDISDDVPQCALRESVLAEFTPKPSNDNQTNATAVSLL